MGNRKKLGDIFVEKGIVTEKTVERTLFLAQAHNRRLGELLEDMGLVTGEELADALAVQYNCETVNNFSKLEIPEELKKLIPLEVAIQNFLFPLKVEDNNLSLAMADPTETRVVGNIAASKGWKIHIYIATKKNIHAAICKHYIGKEPNLTSEKTVLVVDDDNLTCNVFREILKNNGYRVIVATDGMDGYRKAISEKPRVIVADKEMPKLDGYALLGALRNSPETRQIPVILVTGTAINAEEEMKAFEKGFFDYITKPVNEITLVARVKRAFQFSEHRYY
ncbi:MAG: Histidine kinase [Deltaproteobacteria bacterium]|nr:Histidine kinase [Deltaproteobacteria bacterium]